MKSASPASRRDVLKIASVSALVAPSLAEAQQGSDAELQGDGQVFEPGTHRIDTNLIISGVVRMMPGARLEIAHGATLVLTGDLVAAGDHLFTGAGKVDLTRSRVISARPEWWGAVPDDPNVDCVPALTACLEAHVAMQLSLGDYYLHSDWTVDRHNRRIWGIGRTNGERGTRLLRVGGHGAVVLVGTQRVPEAINDFLRGIDMRWIEFGRTEPAFAPVSDIADAPAGLRIRHVLDCVFEGLRAHEHAIGYSIRGAVRSYLQDCTAFRSTSSGTPDNDVFVGFDMSGAAGAGTTGSNASLYVVDCNARTGGSPPLATSVGIRLVGEIADTFIVRFETTNLADGIIIDGDTSRLSAAQRRAGHVDLNIQAPVLDQCVRSGISISNLSDYAMVDVRDSYVALAPGSGAAFSLARCGGNISVSGGQLIGWVAVEAGGHPIGIQLEDVKGASFDGIKLLGFAQPIDLMRAILFELIVAINSPDAATKAPAIRLRDCHMGYLRPRITGLSTAHSAGVSIEGKTGTLTIDTTGIDAAAVAGAPVLVDGRPLRPAASGTIFIKAPFQD